MDITVPDVERVQLQQMQMEGSHEKQALDAARSARWDLEPLLLHSAQR